MAKRHLRGTQLTLPINPPAAPKHSTQSPSPPSCTHSNIQLTLDGIWCQHCRKLWPEYHRHYKVLKERLEQSHSAESSALASSTPTAESAAVAPSPSAPPNEIKAIAYLWRKCIQLNTQIYFEGKGGKAKLNKQINVYCDRIQEICQEFNIHSWDAIPQAEKWIASLFSCPDCGATFQGDMGCSCGYVPFEPCNSAESSFPLELSSSAEVGFPLELSSSAEVEFPLELKSSAESAPAPVPSVAPTDDLVGLRSRAEVSKASGCLHQYPKKKRLKSGETKTYFYWGYYYEVRGKDGKWQSKTVSVLKEKVSQVHQLIEAGATIGDIKAFIKGYLSFDEVICQRHED